MNGSIRRGLFRCLLLLYPEPFGKEFGDEILEIFEQCRRTQSWWRLLADVVLSALKQQIQYGFAPRPKNAPLYSEIEAPANLPRLLGIAAFGAALVTGVLVDRKPEVQKAWTVVRPEAIFWFPIVPTGRYCAGTPSYARERERILTTGVLVIGNSEAPEYLTVVRSKSRLWISTEPWGQYCLETPEQVDRRPSVRT